MKPLKTLANGILKENPTFVLLLGMCPTLAVTTTAVNGLGMGISVLVVLMFSNIAISAVRKWIPSKIRIASYIVIIAGFVTVVDLLLKAYVPSLSKSLGLFIPLIVVNCIILARAEAFASKNGVIQSALDGIGMGIGFSLALFLISAIRELLGNGTLFGFSIFGTAYAPMLIFILPPGAFLVLGILIAVKNYVTSRTKEGN